jgi:NAD(P)-dependent dehydrogenase (short-subunit alcohol dehydrogenase family)
MNITFEGQVALVTGAGSGMGLTTAIELSLLYPRKHLIWITRSSTRS